MNHNNVTVLDDENEESETGIRLVSDVRESHTRNEREMAFALRQAKAPFRRSPQKASVPYELQKLGGAKRSDRRSRSRALGPPRSADGVTAHRRDIDDLNAVGLAPEQPPITASLPTPADAATVAAWASAI